MVAAYHLFTAGCDTGPMYILALKALANAGVPIAIALAMHFAG